MYFVLAQQPFYGKTIERNVRMGGFKTTEAAQRAAVNNAPAFMYDEHRRLIGQTVDPNLPKHIHV